MPPETEKDVPRDGCTALPCASPSTVHCQKEVSVIMIVNPIILFISNMDFVLVIFVEFISLDGAKMQPLICLFAVCELARIAGQLLMHVNALWPYVGCINR